MCGICGFFYRDPIQPVPINVLDMMVDKMVHRGPDDRGVFYTKGGALGQRRLTIIDLIGGHQPMRLTNDKAALVTNGEIYNYIELRRDYLSDISFTGSSDTEVLLHILHKKGTTGISLLNGMFAFAYWDIIKNKVIIARDPVGQKPLFYYFGPNTFVFSSELSSLACHPDVPKEIDTDSLAYYLLFNGYPHPFSPLKDVKKLSPGHYIELDLHEWTFHEETYWSNLPESEPFDQNDEHKYVETFEENFNAAVKRHLRADVEVGIYLSGGLDSSSMVKAAVNLLGRDAIKTFTIKHELDSFDEAANAKETALYFGTQHHEKLLRKEEMLADIDPLLRNNDEPLADLGFLALYQVAKFSQEYVKVILSGNGGDEFYAGYRLFKALRAYTIAHQLLPNSAIKLLNRLTALPRTSYNYMDFPLKIQTFLRGIEYSPAEVLMHWFGSFNHHEIGAVLNENLMVNPLIQADSNGCPMLYNSLYRSYNLLNQSNIVLIMLYLLQQFYLPICVCSNADKASMRVSQELRSPFLDSELMRFANKIPPQMKYYRGKTKYILRKYHERNSPVGISKRPKRGFTVPMASWMATSLKLWANDILDPVQIKKDGFFHAGEVRRLWEEHQNRTVNHSKKLWTIIVFQHWLHTVWKEMKSHDM